MPAIGFGISAVALLGAYLFTRGSRERYSPTTSGRLSPTTQTIVVNRDPADVYQFWLRFDQFPRFMRHLKQVSARKDGTSHWKAYGPGGQLYEWDAETVQSRPNELIAWRSLPGGDVQNEGSAVATLLGREPGQEVREDLRRFKQVVETGEVVHSDASIHQRPHPARPDEASFRLGKPVPGAGPEQSTARHDDPTRRSDDDRAHDAEPASIEQQAARADADHVAAEPVRGGTR